MAQRLVEATPGKTWAVDLHECPVDSEGNKYILVAKDLCTRYVEVAVLKNKDASTVIGALYNSLVLKHGTDIEIVSDQGSEFLNKWAHGLFGRNITSMTLVHCQSLVFPSFNIIKFASQTASGVANYKERNGE